MAPSFAQAAPGAHGAKTPGARMNKMADALGLTDAQKARMMSVRQGVMQQAKAIQENASLTPQAKQAKMMGLSQSTNKQMMAILTPAQREKVKAMRQQRAAKGARP